MIKDILKMVVDNLPNNSGERLRCWYYRKRVRHLGDNVRIRQGITIRCPKNLSIGTGTTISENVYLYSWDNLEIGEKCSIGTGVKILTADHGFIDKFKLIKEQGSNAKPITIENDVFIGAGAIILKGITIGNGAVIGAGAVVTKNVEPYSVMTGVPARKISERKT